jgi:hypothetical protein
MRRTLAFLVLLAVIAGVGCEPKKPVNLPAGWPVETFNVLTDSEVAAYAKALPGVLAALNAADFKPTQSEPTDLIADQEGTIERMKAVPGVLDSLKAAGMTWERFRPTTYKVLSVNYQMALGVGEGLAEGMEGPQGEAFREAIKKMKLVFDQVPAANKEMFFSHLKEFQPLTLLGQETE